MRQITGGLEGTEDCVAGPHVFCCGNQEDYRCAVAQVGACGTEGMEVRTEEAATETESNSIGAIEWQRCGEPCHRRPERSAAAVRAGA